MVIVADSKLACPSLWAQQAQLHLMCADDISADSLNEMGAEVLIVRSKTRVDESLLAHTQVRFVLSTVSGQDHMDLAFLKAKGIEYFMATGCNQSAVVNYTLGCLAHMMHKGKLIKQHDRLKAGVLGAGHIGSKVAHALKRLGFEVLVYDPPKADRDTTFNSCDWDDLTHLDLVSCHNSILKQSSHRAVHLLDEAFFKCQSEDMVLINAGRGETIDTQTLLGLPDSMSLCLDVWENEPNLDSGLINKALIATPHIAGCGQAAYAKGSLWAYQWLAKKLGWAQVDEAEWLPFPIELSLDHHDWLTWSKDVLDEFNPHKLTQEFKQEVSYSQEIPAAFNAFRSKVPLRQEFNLI